jgi:hypothetical protein
LEFSKEQQIRFSGCIGNCPRGVPCFDPTPTVKIRKILSLIPEDQTELRVELSKIVNRYKSEMRELSAMKGEPTQIKAAAYAQVGLDGELPEEMDAAFAGKGPLFDLGLNEEQIIDFLRICFMPTMNCSILARRIEGKSQTVILVGESHDQGREEYRRGVNLFRNFPVVGLESIKEPTNGLLPLSPESDHSLLTFQGKYPDGSQSQILDIEKGFQFTVQRLKSRTSSLRVS